MRDFGGFVTEHDVSVRGEEISQIETETTGKVVIADPRRAKLPSLPRQGSVSRPVFESNGHDAVEHLHHFR